MKKIFVLLKANKTIGLIILSLFAIGGYFVIKNFSGTNSEAKYALAQVERTSLVVSVSGSGQVLASDQVDLKTKAAGEVVFVADVAGKNVSAGQLIAKLDSRTAERSVHEAEISLSRLKLELEKMKGLSTSVGSIRGSEEKAIDNLNKAYEDGFNSVSNTFLDLPGIMSGLQSILLSSSIDANEWNIDFYLNNIIRYNQSALEYRNKAYNDYQSARTAYENNFSDYKKTSRTSAKEEIISLIDQTYKTISLVSEAVKSSHNLIQLYQDQLSERNLNPVNASNVHLASLNSYTSKTNSFLSSLLSIKDTIRTNQEVFVNAGFDLADKEIDVKQAEVSLQEVKDKLADYYLRAPFAGFVAKLDVSLADSVSSGSSLGTLITNKKIVELSLGEVDVAKVKIGQKATITFDALADLEITGTVAEIDNLGSVSQGVVSYNVKIVFDVQDERIKPSMTATAVIIVDSKAETLVLPLSSVKKQNNSSYVEMLAEQDYSLITSENQNSGVVLSQGLIRREIQTGLSSDESIEILSGLKEGDWVVLRKINNNSDSSSQNSNLRIPGMGQGNFR